MAADKNFSVSNILGKGPTDPRLEEVYTVGKQIGKGAFGVVRLASKKVGGAQFAVKSISKAKLVCKEDVKDVQTEVAIMNLVAGHGNVVTLKVRITRTGGRGGNGRRSSCSSGWQIKPIQVQQSHKVP
jgi:serine/threonine protein kinase